MWSLYIYKVQDLIQLNTFNLFINVFIIFNLYIICFKELRIKQKKN